MDTSSHRVNASRQRTKQLQKQTFAGFESNFRKTTQEL